jgi:hypothetical protein
MKFTPLKCLLLRFVGMTLIILVTYRSTEAQIFRQEDYVRLYSKTQLDAVACVHKTLFNLPLNIDASLSFLKQTSLDQIKVLWTSPWGIDWYKDGRISGKNFFGIREFEAEHDELSALPTQWLPAGESTGGGRWTLNKNYSGSATADVDGFIQNIRKLSATELLGFIHIERSNQNMAQTQVVDRLYAIGLAYSKDAGHTWTYAGDVIRPKHDALGDTWAGTSNMYLSNIGGIPYTIVTDGGVDYFYVYFNEYVLTSAHPGSPSSQPFTSVARAKVSDVIANAKAGKITTLWKKYNPNSTGMWTQEGIGGQGAGILPYTLDDSNAGFYDTHSRAAYCAPIKKYLLLSNRAEWLGGVGGQLWRKLVLFTSRDGLSWVENKVVDASFGVAPDYTSPYTLAYGSFVSSDPISSDDFNTVGKDITVIYPRQYNGDYTNSDLYSTKLTVIQDLSPSYSLLLL